MIGCGLSSSKDLKSVASTGSTHNQPNTQPIQGTENLFAEQVAGGRIEPFANPGPRAIVLIFVSTDCPIANRYAPELARIYDVYQGQQVAFWLVYADADESPERIRRHLEEYRHLIPALRDPDHRLVKFSGARRTPEAAVFSPGARRQYLGRIDDRFTDYGKSRKSASEHTLQDAINAVLSGRRVSTPVTTAIGCPIPGVNE